MYSYNERNPLTRSGNYEGGGGHSLVYGGPGLAAGENVDSSFHSYEVPFHSV